MLTEFTKNAMQITPRATHGQVPSARSQKDIMLAANWGHMRPNRGPQIIVFNIRFLFSHSVCQVIHDSFFKDRHDFRSALGDHNEFCVFSLQIYNGFCFILAPQILVFAVNL